MLVYVTAFTLPAAYTAHREAVQRAYTGACASASARWEALGLSRKHKALALALALGCLWLRSGWNTRLVALLVGALAVRCQLKPAEVDRIIAIAGGWGWQGCCRLTLVAAGVCGAWRAVLACTATPHQRGQACC